MVERFFAVGRCVKPQPLVTLKFEYGVGSFAFVFLVGIEHCSMCVVERFGDKLAIVVVLPPQSTQKQKQHHQHKEQKLSATLKKLRLCHPLRSDLYRGHIYIDRTGIGRDLTIFIDHFKCR